MVKPGKIAHGLENMAPGDEDEGSGSQGPANRAQSKLPGKIERSAEALRTTTVRHLSLQ